ncbi:hypothetical protein LEP1GSC016_1649 [Leptospira borgpetersenii serovar Hardjo-bovis str. Sponselee]|uniref:Uncharacterized protein n=1 Tax=Leptospira borgpetersenii serovar Hardjo-bovis str. Sponselee TaxID=1303729 RepID=M6BD42_LEPBO|nr:hypothetical protein LEP1GSC016_1649 [Leptospira borgpetersenii serovar Hardjo-bovis str. Sponselee]
MDLGKKRQRLMKFLLKKGNVYSATKSRSRNYLSKKLKVMIELAR